MFKKIRNVAAAALGVVVALCLALLILINYTPPKKGFADEAEGETISATAAKGKFADEVYLASASVSLDEARCRANGGGEISNAFDKNTSSVWRSAFVNSERFTNTLTLNFNSAITADCIVYGGVFENIDGESVSYGFPKLLKVYTSADGTAPALTATFSGEPESALTVFAFSSPVTLKTLVLEFTEVTQGSNGEVAAASEIYIVKSLDGEAESITKEVNSLFDDYSRFKINSDYGRQELLKLRTRAEGCANYATALKPILDRAEAVLAGLIKKDSLREFSTDSNAANRILLYGGVKEYARDTLLTSSFGTDRQTLGIGGAYGEKFTVYVEADEELSLPSLAFTYENGEGVEEFIVRPLARGVNTVTYPLPATAVPKHTGGPVYLISPKEQSENLAKGSVNVYVEGGYTYPVLRDGGNEIAFIKSLEDYVARLNDASDLSVTADVFELSASNVVITGAATFALDFYTRSDISPQQNISDWNNYIRRLLCFGGITFDKQEKAYDSRNENLKVNFRFTAAYAGANLYENDEFIGIADEQYRIQLLGFELPDPEITRSIGRALDKRGRIWQGFTEEFFVIYGNWLLSGEYAPDIAGVSKNLASDLSTYAISKNYWLNGGDAAWWILQGADPQYWAKLERLYCFEQTGKSLDPTEKFVYYSSLALGADASAYFERWGYYHGGSVYNQNNRFSYDRASFEFKDLLASAKSEGRIGSAKKYIYIDDRQFTLLLENKDKTFESWAAAYNSGQTATVKEIVRTADGYTLFMPDPAKPDAHLCYEVQGYIEGEWKVLGITYGTAFCDGYKYADGGRPRYRIYAYDRLLNCTGTPADVSPDGTIQSETCRVGSVRYNSLKEAVAAAPSGGTVYLLKSFSDSGVIINKSLTILPDPSVAANEVITITASGAGALLTVSAALTFGGTGAQIALDGRGVYRDGALVEVTAQSYLVICSFVNVCFKNSYNYSNGGALYLGSGARQVNLYNCSVENNRAENGGGIYVADGGNQMRLNLCGVSITGNTAKKNGGGIYVADGTAGIYDVSVDGVKAYTVIGGNKAENGGGIYSCAAVNLNGAAIAGNTASKQGGGAYVAGGNIGRRFELTDCTVADNIAGEVMCTAVYFAGGYSTLNGGKIKGGIFKEDGGILNVNAVMPDFTEAEFYLDEIDEEGTILISTVTGFTATEAIVSSLKVANGKAALYGATVVVIPKVAVITVIYEGGSVAINTDCGKFILPERAEGIADGYYISKWITEEKVYFPGDTVEIVFDCEFKAELSPYFKVTLVSGVKTEKINVIQFGEFCLPAKTYDGAEVYGWYCSDGNYYSCGEIKDIEYDTVFTADLKRTHFVTLLINGVETTSCYGYGTAVTLAAPADVFGKRFSHWQADGVNYPAGYTFTLTQDFNAVAVYSSQWTVTVVKDGEKTVQVCDDGEKIPLRKPESVVGGEFLYWLCGGVKYYAGAEYTVSGDAVITAVYGCAAEKLTVVYMADGEIAVSELEFGALLTLAAPETDNLNCWRINGVNYPVGSVICATEDFTAVAATQVSDDEKFTVVVIDYSDGEPVASSYSYEYGSVLCLPLPSGGQDGKVFSHWAINGERYEAGELITITENTVIQAVYDKCITVKLIQLIDGVEKAEIYEIGYTRKFILPEPLTPPEGKVFVHWALGEYGFDAGDYMVAMFDMQIKAVYKQLNLFTVTVENADKNDITATVTEGEIFTLPEPDDKLWGDKFHYWDVNGVRYAAGAYLTVLEDTVIKAVYSAQYKVTLIQFVDGAEKETVYTVSHGDTYKLPQAAEAPEDRIFSYWDVNGVKYAAGDRITVTGDVVISAVYVNSDGEQVVTKSNKKLWIIAGTVGGIAAVAAGACAVWYFVKRKKKADADKK